MFINLLRNIVEKIKQGKKGEKKAPKPKPTPTPTPIPTPTLMPYEKGIKKYFEELNAPAATQSAAFVKEAAKHPVFADYPYLLPAMAQKETQGGKKVAKPNNWLNWGIKIDDFFVHDPAYGIERAASGIGKRTAAYRKFRETKNLKDLIEAYAPAVENDTVLYEQQLRQIMKKMENYEKRK
jgi:hypothetical protein